MFRSLTLLPSSESMDTWHIPSPLKFQLLYLCVTLSGYETEWSGTKSLHVLITLQIIMVNHPSDGMPFHPISTPIFLFTPITLTPPLLLSSVALRSFYPPQPEKMQLPVKWQGITMKPLIFQPITDRQQLLTGNAVVTLVLPSDSLILAQFLLTLCGKKFCKCSRTSCSYFCFCCMQA